MDKYDHNNVRTAFLELLNVGLWDRAPDIDRVRCLTPYEWKLVYTLAKRQTVEGIVFSGIQRLSEDDLPPKSLVYTWISRLELIEQTNRKMNQVIREQSVFFKQHGLHPILLKGQGVARHYIEPLRRICGDIDWYFPNKKEFDAVHEILTQKGFNVMPVRGEGMIYSWKGFVVDHHMHMFDSHSPFSRRLLKNIERDYQPVKFDIQGCQVLIPPPLVEVIQVTLHILKHMLAFGIGMRQLCDLARLYSNYSQSLDNNALELIYRKLHIQKWVAILHNILTEHLGLQASMLPYRSCSSYSDKRIINEVLRSGNFGFFGNQDVEEIDNAQIERRSVRTIFTNMVRFLPYAPLEAISFPVSHFLSNWTKIAQDRKYK